jgi:hypothetical protein
MSSSQQLLLGEGAGGGGPVTYIENVFSTYLYTGNGTSKTINNGIDLSTKGGLVWTKRRVSTIYGNTYHILTDTVRGATKQLYSNGNSSQATNVNMITAFNTNGYAIGSDGNVNYTDASPQTYVSWTFREQPKFFDIVTYTGNGIERTISHNLGSAPGCIIVKRTDTTSDWTVYHRALNATNAYQYYVSLNLTTARTADNIWGAAPTSTVFTVTPDAKLNASGGTYVAYLFAHDAGGFGLTSADNVISCGSYTGGGASAVNITLGYEAQWLLIRDRDGGNWYMFDNMRSFPNPSDSNARALKAESDAAEALESAGFFTATGFRATSSTSINSNGSTYIYIAIRRGPMKMPTQATDVFAIQPRTGTGTETTVTGNPAIDFLLTKRRNSTASNLFASRLTGQNQMSANLTDAQTTSSASLDSYPWTVENNDGVIVGSGSAGSLTNISGATYINYLFRRAPSFFDVVCYTGTGAVTTQTHNLGVAPELMIIKSRSNSGVNYAWPVYAAPRGATQGAYLNSSDEFAVGYGTPFWNDTAPTASVFTLGTTQQLNGSGATYVAYLFASLAGVTKVGSYTGTAALQTISCGFTYGAKFVMIKRTDASGDWFVYDSIRGMTSGTDPYFVMNTTAAEVTGTNYVETTSGGFQVTAAAPAGLNASGGTYIFFAIAI